MKPMKGVKMAVTDHWVFCELLVGESLIKQEVGGEGCVARRGENVSVALLSDDTRQQILVVKAREEEKSK